MLLNCDLQYVGGVCVLPGIVAGVCVCGWFGGGAKVRNKGHADFGNLVEGIFAHWPMSRISKPGSKTDMYLSSPGA